MIRKKQQRLIIILSLVFITGIGYYFALPSPLFNDPICTVLEDRQGLLLGARIALDGQWRFPEADTVPERFAKALIAFEDKRFYAHIGIDFLALARAIRLNLSKQRAVSGGSTLTMQIIRLARKGKNRTLWEKMIEAVMATRLELSYPKKDILSLYASYAPFGGNVVGLGAASWKYFGRNPLQLSWAEAATLAVLPNSPSLIHPGKNRDILKKKRDALLLKLKDRGAINEIDFELALLEPLPEAPLPLPLLAPHLLDRIQEQQHKQLGQKPAIVTSTIDSKIQAQANAIVERHYQHLKGNGIHNAAAIIIEVETGDVLAYIGNTPCQEADCGENVDVVTSPRSTGSIIKPLLFASMLHEGELLPHTLAPDTPTQFGGYSPTNYEPKYDGAVPTSQALSRSLNVPFVYLLHKHGVPKFHGLLQRMGMSTIKFPPQHYGLSLILGGAEATLWDLGGIYASMARTLRFYNHYSGRYDPQGFRPLNFIRSKTVFPISYNQREKLTTQTILSAGSIWHTFNAMVEVARPGEENFWRNFHSSGRIAWKTGTSFGFRDAWAIGCTPQYVIAVWAGNASGEGRPGLIGALAAAPILFDLVQILPKNQPWFEQPLDDLAEVLVCANSGYRAGEYCPTDSLWIPKQGVKTSVCPYHKLIHLDASKKWRVHSECFNPNNMQHQPYFVLPPSQEVYYRSKVTDYEVVPPYHPECLTTLFGTAGNMEVVYPNLSSQIFVPIGLDEKSSATVFEAAHRNQDAIIYWHLDGRYIGKTERFHEIALSPAPGKHTLALVDDTGERIERVFEILERE